MPRPLMDTLQECADHWDGTDAPILLDIRTAQEQVKELLEALEFFVLKICEAEDQHDEELGILEYDFLGEVFQKASAAIAKATRQEPTDA